MAVHVSNDLDICAWLVEIKLGVAIALTLAAGDDFLLFTAHNLNGNPVKAIASSVEHHDA